jgi:hypothetical protein
MDVGVLNYPFPMLGSEKIILQLSICAAQGFKKISTLADAYSPLSQTLNYLN